ncbi:MAG: hypothetical protein ACTSXP_07160 [Promethearchaeota archaeon]
MNQDDEIKHEAMNRDDFEKQLEEAGELAKKGDISDALKKYAKLMEIAEKEGWNEDFIEIGDKIIELRETEVLGGGIDSVEQYMAKKQEKEAIEHYILNELEMAADLVQKGFFDDAISIYNMLLNFVDEMGFPERKEVIKELITKTRKKQEEEGIKAIKQYEKRELMEKERYFMEQIEKASELLNRHEYESAVKVYQDLMTVADEIKWTDKKRFLKELILKARERQKAYKGMEYIDLFLKRREELEWNENYFLDEVEKAADLVKVNKFTEALNKYNSLIEFCEKLSWNDKIRALKELIVETNKAEQRFKKEEAEKQQRLERLRKEGKIKEEAMSLLDEAGKEFKEGNYARALEIYRECLSYFKEINATREIKIVSDFIELTNSKIREIESRKKKKKEIEQKEEKLYKQKEKELLEHKKLLDKKFQEELDRMKQLEHKRDTDREIMNQALQFVDDANKLFNKIKFKVYSTSDDLNEDFDRIISGYEKAIEIFDQKGWKEAVAGLKKAIALIHNEKKNKMDLMLLQQEHQRKLEELDKTFAIPVVSVVKDEVDREKREQAFIEKMRRDKAKREKAFAALTKAQKALNDFEKKSKIMVDSKVKDNEYPEIIKLYQEAKMLFDEIGWKDEVRKIENSINAIKERERIFLEEKKKIEDRLRKQKEEELKEAELWRKLKKAREMKVLEHEVYVRKRMEERRKKREELQSEIDSILRTAMIHYKKNDFTKSKEWYEKAHEWLKEHKWDKEANEVQATIELMSEKIKMQEIHLQKKEFESKQADAFQRRIDALKKIMQERQLEQQVISEQERKRIIEEQEKVKAKESELYEFLSKAQDFMKEKKYPEAIEFYRRSLEIAEELKWTSQIHDLKDFIREAKKKQELEEIRRKKHEDALKKQALLAEQIRGPIEKIERPKPSITDEKRQRIEMEQAIANEAYEFIDMANNSLKEDKKQEAIAHYEKAIEIFQKLGWKREVDLVRQNIEKVMKQIEADREYEKKLIAETKEQNAYTMMEQAEKFLRERKHKEAIAAYQEAADLFQEIGWTNEMEMIKKQIEKIQANMKKSKITAQANQEKEMVNKAFALLDESKKYQRNRKIFKAVEYGKQALEIFEALGDAWARETTQVQKYIEDLEKEKARKEELIRKLKMGLL